jgi:hypothetical protein
MWGPRPQPVSRFNRSVQAGWGRADPLNLGGTVVNTSPATDAWSGARRYRVLVMTDALARRPHG